MNPGGAGEFTAPGWTPANAVGGPQGSVVSSPLPYPPCCSPELPKGSIFLKDPAAALQAWPALHCQARLGPLKSLWTFVSLALEPHLVCSDVGAGC